MRLWTLRALIVPTLLGTGMFFGGRVDAWAVAGALPEPIRVFDARYLRKPDVQDPQRATEIWDTMQTLASLQGLVNREAPRLYILYCSEFGVETDQFWLDWLRGEDGWLKEADLVTLTSPEEAVQAFLKYVKGLAVYDPEVPATSCAASTAAGCDDLLPVRFSRATNSMFALLTG